MRYFFCFIVSFQAFGQLCVDLDQALGLAFEKNRDLLILNEMKEEAKAGKTISLSSWLPHFQGISEGYYNGSYQSVSNSNNTFLTNLSLTQNLFEMGAYYDVKISDLNYKKVENLYESLKNDITYQVRKQYYKVVLDYEKVATHLETVQLLTSLLKRMKDRLKIGEAIALNVNQSQVALASQKTKYYQALKFLKDDLSQLAYLLGFSPDEVLLETNDKQFYVQSNPFLKELYDKAKKMDDLSVLFSDPEVDFYEKQILIYNPLLKTQSLAVKIMNEQVKKAYGEYFPKVQFVANYGGMPNPFYFYASSNFGNQNLQYGVGLQLNWNFFDGGKREGVIKKTKHQKLAAFHELENITQKINLNFIESMTGLQTAISQVMTEEENVSLAELTLQQAFDQLEIGYYTIYDYQIAVDQVVQVKNSLSEAKFDFFKSYFEFEKVIGKNVMELK